MIIFEIRAEYKIQGGEVITLMRRGSENFVNACFESEADVGVRLVAEVSVEFRGVSITHNLGALEGSRDEVSR